ncbi:MAG: DNA mismatch repair protein MutS [Candidatus Binatia bacterium]|nr:DNA mismatch repair protein MutS [Candidatus Binatia bacterium]
MATSNPQQEYEHRRDERLSTLAAANERHRLISRIRLGTTVVGLAMAYAALDRGLLSSTWLWAPAIAFVALVVWHESVKKQQDRARRAAALYESGLARLAGKWRGQGAQGDDFVPDGHLYAADLDLFGEGSLFQLLTRARTRHGERRLAGWLVSPSVHEEILARQEAVEELRPRLDLREDLALAGEELRKAVDADRLAAWGKAAPALQSAGLPIGAAIASTLTIVTFLLYGTGRTTGLPLLLAVFAQAGFFYFVRGTVAEALRGVDRAASDLSLLTELALRLEREPMGSKRGAELQLALRTGGTPASAAIHGLRRRLEIHDSGRNLLFMPIAIVLLWPVHGAFWIDRWRQQFGPAVAEWLDAAGEIEALSSLASHAYEHPEDAFAEIDTSEACFDAEALGHPLLPVADCVRNDITFGGETPAVIISGSNMSGKTTMLRAVGTNAVLALAGATVRARRLRLSPLCIGASIRTQDSLLDGRSRFQAEIDRMRDIMTTAQSAPPLLFLLDEVLAGTNSHDRRIGAAAIVKGLLEHGALGLVTTHDLALAEIDTGDAGKIRNVHFEDHLEDGRMTFDYQMRPGVVRRSNAIELMRSVGLPV